MDNGASLKNEIETNLHISQEELAHFLTFVERVGFSEFKGCARDITEAYKMRNAVNHIGEQLQQGITG